MNSNEEYLEKMLQAVLNGETVTEEEPVQDVSEENLEADISLDSEIISDVGQEQDSNIDDYAQNELGLEGMTLEDSGFNDTTIEETDLADIGLEGLEHDFMTLAEPELDTLVDADNGESAELDIDSLISDIPDIPDTTEIPDLSDIGDMSSVAEDLAGLEGAGFEEVSLDDIISEEPTGNELDIDALVESEPDMSVLEENGLDMNALDESEPDMSVLEENGLDMNALDEGGLDVSGLIENESDISGFDVNDFTESEPDVGELDGSGVDTSEFDGIALEESGMDEMIPEEPAESEHDMNELDMSALDESGLDVNDFIENESDISGLDVNDFTESEAGVGEPDGSEPDINDFDGMALEESGLDDMIPEETIESEIATDEADGLGEELSELDDAFGQSGSDDDIDDEMLALLESVSDSSGDDMVDSDSNEFDFLSGGDDEGDDSEHLTDLMAELEGPQEEQPAEEEDDSNKKKKKKKRRGKKAKEAEEGQNGADGDNADGVETPVEKKPGFFAKLLAALTETDEDEEDGADGDLAGELSDENKELLNELNKEDKKGKKEKKSKKDKKSKKGKNAPAEGEEGEEDGKESKKKKPKKEKKVKEKKETDESEVNEQPTKKLSKKKIMSVALFCITITAAILIMSSVVPSYMQKQNAHVAYDMGNYEETFGLLYGKKLNESDDEILQKTTVILTMNRKLESYQNYRKMGDRELQALDALIQGVELYYEILPEAEQHNVINEVRSIYQEILDTLYYEYGLSEIDVIAISEVEDKVLYTEYLTSIIEGFGYNGGIGEYDAPEEAEPATTESSEGVDDILPEEMEIIEGLQGE